MRKLAILLLSIACGGIADAQPCVVDPPNDYSDALEVMFDPLEIMDPVSVLATKHGQDVPEFSVPVGTTSLTFEYTYCTASEDTFFTSGDEVRFGTYAPIFVVEPGRAVTGNVLAIGLQPGDLSNSDATISRRRNDSFSVTDTVRFDISHLPASDYTVHAFQGLPWVEVGTGNIHPDGDFTSYWFTSAIMTVPIPEPSSGVTIWCALPFAMVLRREVGLVSSRSPSGAVSDA